MRAADGAEQSAGGIAEKIGRARARRAKAVAGAGDERGIAGKIEETGEGPAKGVVRARIRIDKFK